MILTNRYSNWPIGIIARGIDGLQGSGSDIYGYGMKGMGSVTSENREFVLGYFGENTAGVVLEPMTKVFYEEERCVYSLMLIVKGYSSVSITTQSLKQPVQLQLDTPSVTNIS